MINVILLLQEISMNIYGLMYDSKIWETASEKILGVTIDCNLKFEGHVESTLASAGKKTKCSR